jgi:hypothetical protein
MLYDRTLINHVLYHCHFNSSYEKIYTLLIVGTLIGRSVYYEKLITSLRTAQANEYSLDKEQTSYDDLLDALRLSLKGYNIK